MIILRKVRVFLYLHNTVFRNWEVFANTYMYNWEDPTLNWPRDTSRLHGHIAYRGQYPRTLSKVKVQYFDLRQWRNDERINVWISIPGPGRYLRALIKIRVAHMFIWEQGNICTLWTPPHPTQSYFHMLFGIWKENIFCNEKSSVKTLSIIVTIVLNIGNFPCKNPIVFKHIKL